MGRGSTRIVATRAHSATIATMALIPAASECWPVEALRRAKETVSATPASAAPPRIGVSSSWPCDGAECASSARRASSTAAMPRAHQSAVTQRHPTCDTTGEATSGTVMATTGATTANMPNARARARRSVKVVSRIARPTIAIAMVPTPLTHRPASSTPGCGAAAVRRAPAMKVRLAIVSTRRCPRRSASTPVRNTANRQAPAAICETTMVSSEVMEKSFCTASSMNSRLV